jgi:LacI family transcriptional regulator
MTRDSLHRRSSAGRDDESGSAVTELEAAPRRIGPEISGEPRRSLPVADPPPNIAQTIDQVSRITSGVPWIVEAVLAAGCVTVGCYVARDDDGGAMADTGTADTPMADADRVSADVRGHGVATLGDVAARAGVSISAVSRVLSKAPSARVSDATRQRIVEAARELNYRPNFAGRALKSARTQVIGLVVPDLTNALFTELMHGAEDEAAAHGYTLLLGHADETRPGGDMIARLIGEGRVDGMVVQVGDGVATTGLGALLASGAPIVLINSSYPGYPGSVTLDDQAGARMATEHLLSLGHTRIAFANGLPRSFTAKRRRLGYHAAMAAAGITVAKGYETRLGYAPENGAAALERLVAHEVPPSAVVVANVNAAVGMLAAARTRGVRVPDDLSVVTVHDSWTAENTWPPLTAVKMQFYAMGRTAVRGVIARIESGVSVDVVITNPAPELVERDSSAPVRRH